MKIKLIVLSFVFIFIQIKNIQSETIAKITTEFGIIKLKLYNETPIHRDNFIKNIKSGFYNEANFHRIIKNFMIQGGDILPNKPQSFKDSFNYVIPAEINSKYIHKKGALAAARTSDNVNPERKSSGTQFYIVVGEVIPKDAIESIESNLNSVNFQNIAIKHYYAEEKKLKDQNLPIDYKELEKKATEYGRIEIAKNPAKLTQEQKNTYTTIGGTPHLDGAYTVFGEVIEGMDVVEKISKVKTITNDKPEKELKFSITVIEQ